jgi:cell division protein FtsB
MAVLKQYQSDKIYYQQRIEEDKRKLRELKTNNENLEKFAREQYYMKKDDEDLFIIVSEEDEKKRTREAKGR